MLCQVSCCPCSQMPACCRVGQSLPKCHPAPLKTLVDWPLKYSLLNRPKLLSLAACMTLLTLTLLMRMLVMLSSMRLRSRSLLCMEGSGLDVA